MVSIRRSRPWLLTLALLASVSLSLLPTLGRLYRGAQPQNAAVEAFCTSRGLAWRAAETVSAGFANASRVRADAAFVDAFANDISGDDSNDTSPGGASGDDCGYCTLTATTVLPAPAVSLGAFELAPQRAGAHYAAPALPRAGRYDRSPRGPPAGIAA